MEIYCVRAEFGTYTQLFLDGGYAAIGWIPDKDLSAIKTRDDLYPLYKQAHPADTSNVVIGQQVGQIARFLMYSVNLKKGKLVMVAWMQRVN